MKSLVLLLALSILPVCGQSQNLLPNGDFESVDPGNAQKPAHWDLPDGLGLRWTMALTIPGEPSHGKAIRLDTSISETDMVASWTKAGITQWIFPHPKANAIAETYGLSLYSDAVPVEPGKAYKVSFDYFSEKGTAGKVWFRGYGLLGDKQRRLYEGIVECAGKGSWRRFSGTFHPTKHKPGVTEFKVMLFVYYPPGVCWFDNVTVEKMDETPLPATGHSQP